MALDGYRNGYWTRMLYTRVGPVTLQVPQTRDGNFSTDIFKRYQRSEQAFVLALMEMTVQGVSTRKVAAIKSIIQITTLHTQLMCVSRHICDIPMAEYSEFPTEKFSIVSF